MNHPQLELGIVGMDDDSRYVDTRKHGTVPQAGFGMGFARMLGHCEF